MKAKPTPEDLEQMRAAQTSGRTLLDIGRQFDCSVQTVCKLSLGHEPKRALTLEDDARIDLPIRRRCKVPLPPLLPLTPGEEDGARAPHQMVLDLRNEDALQAATSKTSREGKFQLVAANIQLTADRKKGYDSAIGVLNGQPPPQVVVPLAGLPHRSTTATRTHEQYDNHAHQLLEQRVDANVPACRVAWPDAESRHFDEGGTRAGWPLRGARRSGQFRAVGTVDGQRQPGRGPGVPSLRVGTSPAAVRWR